MFVIATCLLDTGIHSERLIAYTSRLPLLDADSWGFLIQPDPETFQFIGDDFEIVERFQYVEDDKNQVARSGDSDDLSTSTFTIFGSFNDTFLSAKCA